MADLALGGELRAGGWYEIPVPFIADYLYYLARRRRFFGGFDTPDALGNVLLGVPVSQNVRFRCPRATPDSQCRRTVQEYAEKLSTIVYIIHEDLREKISVSSEFQEILSNFGFLNKIYP